MAHLLPMPCNRDNAAQSLSDYSNMDHFPSAFRQAEELQLHGLVERLTRKNRHIQKELADAHHANEEQFAALMKAQADRVSVELK